MVALVTQGHLVAYSKCLALLTANLWWKAESKEDRLLSYVEYLVHK